MGILVQASTRKELVVNMNKVATHFAFAQARGEEWNCDCKDCKYARRHKKDVVVTKRIELTALTMIVDGKDFRAADAFVRSLPDDYVATMASNRRKRVPVVLEGEKLARQNLEREQVEKSIGGIEECHPFGGTTKGGVRVIRSANSLGG